MRYLLVTILVVLISGGSAPAHPGYGDLRNESVSIEVVSENGNIFPLIPHRDTMSGGTHVTKKYLEARKGETYGIIIRNLTPHRLGVVIAVDGRNIISGKRSELRSSDDMYIINGYEYARYDGWRTGKNTVNKFYFTNVADSYAQRTFHDRSAMGVIAVAVYREKQQPMRLFESKSHESLPSVPSPQAGGKAGVFRDNGAGTGFGDEQYSPSTMVMFESEGNPVEKTLIKYEWREVLCRKGLLNCRQETGNRLWSEDGYAPYPPDYQRR